MGRLSIAEKRANREGSLGGSDVVGDLAALALLTTSLSTADVPRGIERALDILCDATGTESAELFLAEPAGHDMLLTTYRGPFRSAFFQMVRFAPGEGFPGRVMLDGRSAATNSLEMDDRYLRSRVKAKGYHSYLCVPLVIPQGVIGAICLASRDSGVSLGAAERLLTWASTPIASALQVGLFEARERVRAGAAMSAATQDGAAERLLEQTLQQAVISAEADGGTLVLFGHQAGEVARRVSLGIEAEVRCPAIAGGCPALGGSHGIALFGARASWPAACRQARGRGAMHYCLPMRAGNEAIGMIQLVYRDEVPTPPTRHLRLLLEIADQAGDMARVACEQERARREAESVIQRWLHPKPEPVTVDRASAVGIRSVADEPLLRVRCFGRFELERGGALAPLETFKRRKSLALLKILLVHAGRPVPNEMLIEWLWPGSDPRAGANRLYVVVHALREAIEPGTAAGDWSLVRTSGDHYLFDADACWLDLVEFRAAIDAGRRAEVVGDQLRALTAWDVAVRLYRGDLLADDPFDEWCLMEREHLRETYLDALQRIAAISRDAGDLDRAIDAWRRALQVDPLREGVQRRLIECLWMARRRDEALNQYEQLRTLLRDELDIAPMPETEAVVLRIRREEPPRLSGSADPL